MQTKFSKISNIILKYFLIFAIAFLWLNYLRVDNILCFALSICISAGVGYGIHLFNKPREKRANISAIEREKIENVSLQFLYSSKQKTMDFFQKLFLDKYDAKKFNNYLDLGSYAFVPFYETDTMQPSDLYKVLKYSDKALVVACVNYDNNIEKVVKLTRREIHILDQTQVYKMLTSYDKIPDFGVEKQEKTRPKLGELRHIALARANAKNYLISSFFILLTAFFVRFNIYYTVFSTLLLVLAGACLFQPKPKTEDFTL